MSKIGAVAMLAMATFAGRVSAQDCATDVDMGNEDSRCFGPEDSQKKMCCDGFKCIQQNPWYAQCRADDADIPDGWDGNEIEFGSDSVGLPVDSPEPDVDSPAPDADSPAQDVDSSASDAEGDMDAAPGAAPEEVEPVAAGDGLYMAVIAKDYIPSEDMPTLVMLEDIMDGSFAVADQGECEDQCDANAGCNAASYYLDPSGFVGAEDKNCWLKIIGEPCELPSDTIDDPNAVLLLKVDTCPDAEELIAMGPEAMGPDAFGPDAAMGPEAALAPEADDIDEFAPRDFDVDDSTTAEAPTTLVNDPNSAVTVRSAVTALAVAAVGAAVLV